MLSNYVVPFGELLHRTRPTQRVVVALVVGKPLGIVGASAVAVWMGVARKSEA